VPIIQKKICLLGGFAVGKTSLVARYVRSIFSDKYLTTIGVKIDRKPVVVGDTTINLVIWDIAGEDEFQTVQRSYLRGSSGYLLVADGTRASTFDTACALQDKARDTVGDVPFILALNKVDLASEWQVSPSAYAKLAERGWTITRTSAKTGDGVEDTFLALARRLAAR
jgi:small GTP-binding protein